MIEDSQRDMESVMRARDSMEHDRDRDRDLDQRSRNYGGRESPIATMLEEQEEADDEDARSVASGETVRISTSEQFAQLRGKASHGRHTSNGTTNFDASPPTIAREELLQEQNAKLAARLEAISLELDEATKIGQSLRSQHAEAASTIRTLEDRVQGLEKAVEGRVAESQGTGWKEAEVRWNGWRVAFEESWKKEKRDWDEERGKLVAVVREWEEKKRRVGSGSSSSGDESEEGDNSSRSHRSGERVSTNASETSGGSNEGKGSKKAKAKKQRKRAAAATRVALLAKGMDELSSAGAGVVDREGTTKGSGASSFGSTKAGEEELSNANSGFDASTHHRTSKGGRVSLHFIESIFTGIILIETGGSRLQSQVLPYGAAGAVLLIGVAAAWALNLKMKE